jgi:hypothetical protein
MTSFTIINTLGWIVLLAAYIVKSYMATKENQIQKELEARTNNMRELSTEELVQLKYDLEDLKLRRFGAFGSYGVHAQILSFGIGLFIANFLTLIF